jgi:hypothetical protein
MSPNESLVPPITVNAFPAKAFFVNMLIRDIELKDSILDLLDNCLDGAMRAGSAHLSNEARPYEGYLARITFNDTSFMIEDNCGGIPVDTARYSAFRLGRVDTEIDSSLPTVGVYGIGMKRAIFKLGRDATVESRTSTEQFTVKIDKEWMENDALWTIPIDTETAALDDPGTRITVMDLNDGISRMFSDETGFVEDLKKTIAANYGIIIEKGFEVIVNGDAIAPIQTALLMDSADFQTASGIMPFVYQVDKDGVEVSVVIGFYRDLPADEEEEEALEGKPTSGKAGITIICNDRVVIYADKTRLTGWGEATVPQYHTQFVSIAGWVTFRSNNASLLPITTTKRGLDGNSQLYLTVKEQIREGIKYFTDFTNKWKKSRSENASVQRKAVTVRSAAIAARVPMEKRSVVHKGLGGWKYKPPLPLPKESDPLRQIRFARPLSDIAVVSGHLFDDPNRSPGDVGAKCFDDVLKKAQR